MKKLVGITLGIMTALGGFVDIGQIVFTLQAGSLFRYQLGWAVMSGTVGIILYMEMCGRIAVVAGKPVFVVVRETLGRPLGLATLIASNLLNLLTCAAELAGLGIVVHLLTGWPDRISVLVAAFVLGVAVFVLKFEWIERVFGLAGLVMIVFGVSAVWFGPDWKQVAFGLVPQHGHPGALYWYYAIGLFSAILMAYEVHFYSSGAIEERWTTSDLGENFAVAAFGSALGGLLTLALLLLGALVFLPRNIFPESLGIAAVLPALSFGRTALVTSLFGMAACMAGAAVETALSAGYNYCQFFRKRWSKSEKPSRVRVFTINWGFTLILAAGLALSGIPALTLVNVSIVFGMVVLPLTYYPILKIAGNKSVMGKHANSAWVSTLGYIFLFLITCAAVAAVPLLVVTRGGKP
jgi:Mn2+/Fe2+ NRAMP family transporter